MKVNWTAKPRRGPTCEGDLGVAVGALLLDAVLVGFGGPPGALHVPEVLPPPLPPRVLLQPLLLGPTVLEPHLRAGQAGSSLRTDGAPNPTSRCVPPPPQNPRGLTCTTRMSKPVSDESCSRTCRAGLGELL